MTPVEPLSIESGTSKKERKVPPTNDVLPPSSVVVSNGKAPGDEAARSASKLPVDVVPVPSTSTPGISPAKTADAQPTLPKTREKPPLTPPLPVSTIESSVSKAESTDSIASAADADADAPRRGADADAASSMSSFSKDDTREQDFSEPSMSDSRCDGDDERERSLSSSLSTVWRPRSQSTNVSKYPLKLHGTPVPVASTPTTATSTTSTPRVRGRYPSITRQRSHSSSIASANKVFQSLSSTSGVKHEQPPELESVELDVRHGRGRERGRLDSDNDDAGPAVDLSAYSPKKMSVPSTTVKRKVPPMKRMSTGSFDEATAVRQLVIPEARSNFADFRKVLLLQFRAFITPPDLLDELLEYYLEPILTEKKSSRTISDDDPDYQKLGDGSGRLVWVPHPDENLELDEVSRKRQLSRAKAVSALKYWIQDVFHDNDFSDAMCDKLRELSDTVDALNEKNCPTLASNGDDDEKATESSANAAAAAPPSSKSGGDDGLSLEEYLANHDQVKDNENDDGKGNDDAENEIIEEFGEAALAPTTPTILSLRPVVSLLDSKKSEAKRRKDTKKTDDGASNDPDRHESVFEHIMHLSGQPVHCRAPSQGSDDGSESQMDLLDLTPSAVAQQLTLIVFDMFKKINLVEFTDQSWKRKPPKTSNPSPRKAPSKNTPTDPHDGTRGDADLPSSANVGSSPFSTMTVPAQFVKHAEKTAAAAAVTATPHAKPTSSSTQYLSPLSSDTVPVNKVNASPILRAATASPEAMSRMAIANESKAQLIQRAATIAPELMEGQEQDPYAAAPFDHTDAVYHSYDYDAPKNAFSEHLMQAVDSQMKGSDAYMMSPSMPSAASPFSSHTELVFPRVPRAATLSPELLTPTNRNSRTATAPTAAVDLYGSSPLSQQTMPLSRLPRALTMSPAGLSSYAHPVDSPSLSSSSPHQPSFVSPTFHRQASEEVQHLSRHHLSDKLVPSPHSAQTMRNPRAPAMQKPRAQTASNTAVPTLSANATRSKTLPRNDIRGSKGSARKLRKLMGKVDFMAAQSNGSEPVPATSGIMHRKPSRKFGRARRAGTLTDNAADSSPFLRATRKPTSPFDFSAQQRAGNGNSTPTATKHVDADAGSSMTPFEFLSTQEMTTGDAGAAQSQNEASKSPSSTSSSAKQTTELRYRNQTLSIDITRPDKDDTHVLQLDGHVVTPVTHTPEQRQATAVVAAPAVDSHLYVPAQAGAAGTAESAGTAPESGRVASPSVSRSAADSTTSAYHHHAGLSSVEHSQSRLTGYLGDTPSVSSGTDAESVSGASASDHAGAGRMRTSSRQYDMAAPMPHVSSHSVGKGVETLSKAALSNASLQQNNGGFIQSPNTFDSSEVDAALTNHTSDKILAPHSHDGALLSPYPVHSSFSAHVNTDASSTSSQPATSSDPSSASATSSHVPQPPFSNAQSHLPVSSPSASPMGVAANYVPTADHGIVETEKSVVKNLEDDPPDFAPPLPGVDGGGNVFENPDKSIPTEVTDTSVTSLNPESSGDTHSDSAHVPTTFAQPAPSPTRSSRARPRWLGNKSSKGVHRSKSATPTTDRRPGRTAMDILLGLDPTYNRGAGHSRFTLKGAKRFAATPASVARSSRDAPPPRRDPRFGPMPTFTPPSRPPPQDAPRSLDRPEGVGLPMPLPPPAISNGYSSAPGTENSEAQNVALTSHESLIDSRRGSLRPRISRVQMPSHSPYDMHEDGEHELTLAAHHDARMDVLHRVAPVSNSSQSQGDVAGAGAGANGLSGVLDTFLSSTPAATETMTTPKRAPDTNDTSATDDAGSSMSMPNESNNTPQLDSTQVPAAPVTLSDAYFSRSKTHRPTQSCGDSQAAAQHHTAPAASQPAVPDTTPQLGTRDYDDEDGLLPNALSRTPHMNNTPAFETNPPLPDSSVLTAESPVSHGLHSSPISLTSPALPPGTKYLSQSMRLQRVSKTLPSHTLPDSPLTVQIPSPSTPQTTATTPTTAPPPSGSPTPKNFKQHQSSSVRIPNRRRAHNPRSIHALGALNKDMHAKAPRNGGGTSSPSPSPTFERDSERTGRYAPPVRLSSKEALRALRRTTTAPASSISPRHNTMPSQRSKAPADVLVTTPDQAQAMASMSQQVKRMPDFSDLHGNTGFGGKAQTPQPSSSSISGNQPQASTPNTDRNTVVAPTKKKKKSRSRGVDVPAPNAISFIEQFNQISYWAATEVLCLVNATDRQRMLRHVLKIADECLRLQNLHTSLAIANGVQMVSVERLQHLKELRNDDEHVARLNKLKSLRSSSNSYKTYRRALELCLATGKPCIPFMAVAFSDLYFFQQYPAEQGRIDFKALKKSAKLIYQIQSCQLTDYRKIIKENTSMRSHLEELLHLTLTEEQLYARSHDLEPPSNKKGVKSSLSKRRKNKKQHRENLVPTEAMPDALAARLRTQNARKEGHISKRHTNSPRVHCDSDSNHNHRRRRSSIGPRTRQFRGDELSSAPTGTHTGGSLRRRGRSRFASNLMSIGSRGAFGASLNRAVTSIPADTPANNGGANTDDDISAAYVLMQQPSVATPKRSRSAFGQRSQGSMMARRASRAYAAAATSRS